MRKLVVITMLSLDGVMQAPGGPEEDGENGFHHGGWTVAYGDDVLKKSLDKDMQPTDLLLGRKTFAIWEDYWPKHADFWPGINDVTKYVVSTTMVKSDWQNSVFLKSIEDVKKLKDADGSDLHVWGSSDLIQTLLQEDLVDELRLKIYPLTLGPGKRLFQDGAIPAAFKLTDGAITPSGVIVANYQRAGEVKTGRVGPE